MDSAQVVKMSVANIRPSQDSNHPDDHFKSRYVTPGFKPFSHIQCCCCFLGKRFLFGIYGCTKEHFQCFFLPKQLNRAPFEDYGTLITVS